MLLGIVIWFSSFYFVNTAEGHTTVSPTVDGSIADYGSRSGFIYANPPPKVNCDTWTKGDGSTLLGGDSDGDGICNAWEDNDGGATDGLKIDFNTGNNYPTKPNTAFYYEYLCGGASGQDPNCPNPNRKDVYVELDWMMDAAGSTHIPLNNVIQDVKNAFLNAPLGVVPNDGVVLHVQLGEVPADSTNGGDIKWHKNSIYTSNSNQAGYTGFYRLKQFYFGTVDERSGSTVSPPLTGGYTPKWTTLPNEAVKQKLTAKFEVFHYAMIINKRAEDGTSSGWGETWGNDFALSLGGFNPIMGSKDHQEATFMHELGHNLNLKHGGDEDKNRKPNYLSIMSYTFQFKETFDSCRPLDFSKTALIPLNELSLAEGSGVGGGYNYPNTPCTFQGENVADTLRWTQYNTTNPATGQIIWAPGRLGVGIDWDGSIPNEIGVIQDINKEGGKTSLTAYQDWSNNLKFRFIDAATASGSAAGSCQDPVASSCQSEDANEDPVGEIVDSSGASQEITYGYVKNSRIAHLSELSEIIMSQSNSSFKEGYNGKLALIKYVSEAADHVGNDEVAAAYDTLTKMKKQIETYHIITGEKALEQISNVLDDKVQAFQIAQFTPGIQEVTHPDDLRSIVEQLSNKVSSLDSAVNDLSERISKLEAKGPGTSDNQFFIIGGLIIAIIILSVALAYRRSAVYRPDFKQSQ